MTKVKSFAVVLLTAATLASPALARGHVAAHANDARANVSSNAACVQAPRVGAFASDPWTQPPCEAGSTF